MVIALPGYVLCLAACIDIKNGVGVEVGVFVGDGVRLAVGVLIGGTDGEGVAAGRRVLVTVGCMTVAVEFNNCG